jgi:hypothetical protein
VQFDHVCGGNFPQAVSPQLRREQAVRYYRSIGMRGNL